MTDTAGDGEQAISHQAPGPRISPRKVLESLSALKIPIDRIKSLVAEAWSRGGNADVIPAELEFASGPSSAVPLKEPQHVAVKKLRFADDSNDARALAALAHEVHLLNELSHDNIIKVVGFVEDAADGVAWIVLPWEKNGNLREFVASAEWEFPERLSLIYDVACGVEYLHSREPPVCHGDLKSLNILVNSQNRAVLTDFGSARVVGPAAGEDLQARTREFLESDDSNEAFAITISSLGTCVTLKSAGWTLRWAAPELLNGSAQGLESDVWAFGWICWEVMTSNFPFAGTSDVSAVLQIIEGRLPSLHGDARLDQVTALVNLVARCWNPAPRKRPTAKTCEREVYWMDRVVPSSRNSGGSARLLISLGFMHLRHNRINEANDCLERSMKIATSAHDEWAMATTYYGLGEVYRLRGQYAKAREHYSTACVMYARINDPSPFASAVNSLADIHRKQGSFHRAVELYNTAQQIYSQTGNQPGLANTLNGLGEAHRMRGETSKAKECYIRAYDISTRIEYPLGAARASAELGDIYGMEQNYPKAVELYKFAHDAYTRLGSRLDLANTLDRLCGVFRLQGNYAEAEKSCFAAREIYTDIRDGLGVAHTFNNWARILWKRKDVAGAEEAYQEARRRYTEEVWDKLALANNSREMGRMWLSQSRFQDAEEILGEASNIYRQLGMQDDYLDCESYRQLARRSIGT